MWWLQWTLLMVVAVEFCVSQDLVYFPGLVNGLYGYSYGGYSPYYNAYVRDNVRRASVSSNYRGVSFPAAGGYRGGALPLSGGYRGGALPASGGYRGLPSVGGGYRGLAPVGGGYRGASIDYYDNVYASDAQPRLYQDDY